LVASLEVGETGLSDRRHVVRARNACRTVGGNDRIRHNGSREERQSAMEVALVTFLGAGLTSIGAGFGIVVPEKAMLGGFELVRYLYGADNPRTTALVTEAVGEIWQDWQTSGLPRDVAEHHLAALPEIMDRHRPAADLQIGAIAAAKAALKSQSSSTDAQARRLAAEIVGLARDSGSLTELQLSEPIAFFFLERLYTRLLAELETLERLIASFDVFFYKGLWRPDAEGVEEAGRLATSEPTAMVAANDTFDAAPAAAGDGADTAFEIAPDAPGDIALGEEARAECARLAASVASISGGTAAGDALRAAAASHIKAGTLGAADRTLRNAEDEELQAAQTDIDYVRSYLSAAAETRAARGGIEEIKRDYRRAARHYVAATRCLPSNDGIGRWRFRICEALALTKQHEAHGDEAALTEAAAVYAEAGRQLPPGEAPTEWASTQLTLANLLLVLGDREGRSERFDEAARHARAASDAYGSVNEMPDWGRAQLVFGHALRKRGDASRSTADLEDARFAYRAALGVFARDRMPEEWVTASSSLGLVLVRLGELGAGPEVFEESLQHLNAALVVAERTDVRADIARLHMARGNAMLALFAMSDEELLAAEATEAFQAALSSCDCPKHPREAVSMRHRLAMALWAHGVRSGSQERLGAAARELIGVLDQAQDTGDTARVAEVHRDLQTLHNDLTRQIAGERSAALKIA